jgi:hypothetical protein
VETLELRVCLVGYDSKCSELEFWVLLE